jgi:uncharacterized membrane protein YphA (DoxX/SURF4 family)
LSDAKTRTKQVFYWLFTLVIAWEMAAGAMWDLLRIKFVRDVFDHLGYPHYLLFIIGVWKLPCALALLAPRFPRLKEWAYAGAFFNYTGAAASHLFAGDAAPQWLGPVIFAGMTLASWALRPDDRRLPSTSAPSAVKPAHWIAAGVGGVAMVILALLTLPG